LQRRDILKLTVLGAAESVLPKKVFGEAPAPIIDTHIHLFDPTRPEGVPWPPKDDAALYKQALPGRYTSLTAKHHVVGAIAVEASPLLTDNDWLLRVVGNHPVMVGMIGDLIPGSQNYMADLERLHRDPLFLGIRYGNLWDRDLSTDLEKPGFVDGLKALAQAGLVLDSANPDAKLIRAIRTVGERVPELRIVIDHLPNAKLPTQKAELDQYWADLKYLGQRPNVFVKLSEIPTRRDGRLVTDAGAYRGRLDRLWFLFGEDRVLFGSDWPNSDHVATYDETLSIVRAYAATKDPGAQAKYFWKNSIAAYKWKPRRQDQHLD